MRASSSDHHEIERSVLVGRAKPSSEVEISPHHPTGVCFSADRSVILFPEVDGPSGWGSRQAIGVTTMPVLHKSPSDSHYYVRSSHLGRRMTLQLTPEGVRYLMATLGHREGDEFDHDVVEYLYEKKWAYTHGGGLGEEVDGLGGRSEMSGGPSPSQPGPLGSGARNPKEPRPRPAISIRMEAYDPTILDQSAKEIIETAVRTGAVVLGPFPLPTRVERYTVIGGMTKRQIEVRTHKRIIDIRVPAGPTIEALNRLSLPAGVDIRIKVGVAR